ncbi:hypothetical protein EYR36_004407 [Pleurotus pulmonarius]|nr:hypothetical protein EYR36_004407 [Pleurotus pulmonarius]
MLVKRVPRTPDHHTPQSPQIFSGRHGLRRLRWGIFEIAFEPPSRRYAFLDCIGSWPRIPPSVPYATRLLRDVFSLAPFTLATYMFACLWTTGSSILSLYMAIMAVDLMSGPIQCVNDGGTGPLPALVYSFMASTLVSTLVERMKKDASMSLRGHLRSYFLPQLVRAKLEAEIEAVKDVTYPESWQFEEVSPGWAIIEQLCFKASIFCVAFIQACILFALYLKKTSLEFKLLVVFGVYYPVLLYTIPSDGVGGAEYTFWTSNLCYRRLAALYTLIFSPKYEEDIRKDVYNKEYEKTSRDLGVHRPDATALASNDIPRPLLWDLWSCVILDLPVLAFALTLPWSSPTNCIAKSLLLRLMTESIRSNIDLCVRMRTSFDDTCQQAERFYVPFTKIPTREDPEVPSFPNPAASSKGMKIQFSGVDVAREDATRNVLRNLSFIVHPGQIVAIVGPNACDKSTVLKLLPRLIEPSNGAILVDDQAIESITPEALRESMTVLLPTPDDLYPISLKENITFGLANGNDFGLDLVDRAARLGGAYELIRRLGYDAIPTVIPVLGQSMGASSKAAVDARNSAMSARRPVQLTREEMQRVLASRAFFRILCNNPRLVVIGDAFSELDPVTETNILNNFVSLRQGRSIIYAAHRVNNIVTQADLVLYVENGVMEQGTHQQLLDNGGGYATMCAMN